MTTHNENDAHTSRFASESSRDAARERLARRRAQEANADVDEETNDLGGHTQPRSSRYSVKASRNHVDEQALLEANRPRTSSRRSQASTGNAARKRTSGSASKGASSALSAAASVAGVVVRSVAAAVKWLFAVVVSLVSAIVSFALSLPRTVLLCVLAVIVAFALVVGVSRSCTLATQEQPSQEQLAQESDDASDAGEQAGDAEEAPVEQADFSNIPSFVSSETIQALQAKTDDPRIVSIVNNAAALGVTGETYQRKMLELAAKDPQAIDYVADFPSSYPAQAGQPYDGQVIKGTIPDLKQWDQRWGYVEYCAGGIGSTGCCPTSLSMVYMGLTGKTDKTPADMAALATQGGYAVDGEGTIGDFLTDEAPSLGLSCVRFYPSSESLTWYLQNGYAVIVNVGPGDFTEGGHFFVARGVASDGTIEINDPYSSINTAKTWDADVIVNQSIAMYAFKAL